MLRWTCSSSIPTRTPTTIRGTGWRPGSGCLVPGGVAVFHDIVAARPEIQVAEAVRDWVGEQPGGWRWQEFPGTWGLGLLWKTTDAPDFEAILG